MPERPLTFIAARYSAAIMSALQQEYPNAPRHVMRSDEDRPIPREIHPAFYGCFDWHSALEMHWALAVLAREVPDGGFVPDARALLDRHLSAANLQREADYIEANPGFERPYGWGWVLTLTDELAAWAEAGDEQAAYWAANLRPLAERIEAGFLAWLPKQAHPDRSGVHSNSAFALTRALPYGRRRAGAGHPALRDAITDAAERWYGGDEGYTAGFEPGGSDFLSPTLAEIVVMRMVLAVERVAEWFVQFLEQGLPSNLLYPVRVTDPEDGQGAHLHGLNLYRVHALRHVLELAAAGIPESVDPDRQRREIEQAILRHTDAGIHALRAEGWMAEHWLAAYGVLAFR